MSPLNVNEIVCELVPLEEDPDITPTAVRKVDKIPAACAVSRSLKSNSVVVFRTADDVIFRIDDFYLKANR